MAPSKQTRVVVSAFNPADPTSTLKTEEAAVPSCAAGEVLVRVTARPVNPADVFSIMVRARAAHDAAGDFTLAPPRSQGCGAAAVPGLCPQRALCASEVALAVRS
jgi:NADPH:quinone reductase-like Zn-dependent oxidoreductase